MRSRLYFKAAKAADGDKANPDLRELEVRKNNYGPTGEVIRMVWQNGVFVPVSAAVEPGTAWPPSRRPSRLFLDLLDRLHRARPARQPASDLAKKLRAAPVRQAPRGQRHRQPAPSPTPCSGCSTPEPSASKPSGPPPSNGLGWCAHDPSNPLPTPFQPPVLPHPPYPPVEVGRPPPLHGGLGAVGTGERENPNSPTLGLAPPSSTRKKRALREKASIRGTATGEAGLPA